MKKSKTKRKERDMAGALKTYEMPTVTKKTEKRDRADDLFKSMGLEPIEGKAEEEAAKASLEILKKTMGGTADEKDVQDAKEKFIEASKKAIESKGELSPPLKKTISFAQDALRMGLYYLDSFIGMVATRLADRNVSIYFNNSTRMPIDTESVETIEDFVRKNTHLGETFLEMILSQYRVHDPANLIFEDKEIKKTITDFILRLNNANNPAPVPLQNTNSNVSLIGDNVNNVLVRTGNFLNRILQPKEDVGFVTNEKKEWVFNVLDLAALSQVLTPGSMGAITMAVSQINRIPNCERFTLKQLIMSEGVRDIFAIFVAFQYQLASGGNAYAGRASTQGNARGTTFMLSAGLETRKQLNTLVMGAKDWFSDVYETTNPIYTKISGEIEEAKRKKERIVLNEGWKTAFDEHPKNIRVLDEFIKDNRFTTNLDDNQRSYVKFVFYILQREQFLNGIPQKILRHVN